MKPIALLFALFALCCAVTLMFEPAAAQQQEEQQRSQHGKQRGYASGNFGLAIGGTQGWIQSVEPDQEQPSVNCTAPCEIPPPVTQPDAPQVRLNGGSLTPGADDLNVTYRRFTPNGEPVRATVNLKEKQRSLERQPRDDEEDDEEDGDQ